MADLICEVCGERNPPGTEFCRQCESYLAWDPTGLHDASQLQASRTAPAPGTVPAQGQPGGSGPAPGAGAAVARSGPAGSGGPPASGADSRPSMPDALNPMMRATAEPSAVTLTPGREPATVTVAVTNMSDIVDRYLVTVPDAPPWLQAPGTELRLLPGKDGTVALSMAIPAPPLIPVGQHRLTVRVGSATKPERMASLPFELTVGLVEGPITLVAEPSVVRIRDADQARLRLTAENLSGNRPVPLTLEGSDPEGVVRFRFEPPVLTIPPSGSATATVYLLSPPPPSGQELNRQLTITGTEGTKQVSAMASIVQATTAQVLTMTVEPTLLRLRDTGGAQFTVTAQNPGGVRPTRLALRGNDPERMVRFTFRPPVLSIPPGGRASAQVHVEAPQPEPGQEANRQLTVTGVDGDYQISADVGLTQYTSPLATELRLEPAVVRVRDSEIADVQLIVDNRNSRRPVRLALTGSDPERVIRFAFEHPLVEVAAGAIGRSWIRLQAPMPDYGQEVTHSFTVQAADGARALTTDGSFLQQTSELPVPALTLRLDPSVVRTEDSNRGVTTLVADNRSGTGPADVQLYGADPERLVQFVFTPPALHVPPGQIVSARVNLKAPRPDRGQQSSRTLTISAADQSKTVETTGTFLQTTSDRRWILRVVLTILGSLMMIAGVFLPWTKFPVEHNGFGWSLLEFAQQTNVDLSTLNFNIPMLTRVAPELQSAGLVVLIFAGITLFGLTGNKGRLTRTGSTLSLLFVVSFSVGLIAKAGSWAPGIGIFLVIAGAVCAFIGGLYARR